MAQEKKTPTDIIVTKDDAKMQMQENEIVLYQPNDAIHLEVRLEEDTVWINRNQMAVLFGRDVKTIGKHINNVLREELKGVATVANFAIVQNEGGSPLTSSRMPMTASSASTTRFIISGLR